MRPVRSLPLLILVLVVGALSGSGCARRAERLVGNERLIRGPGGLGTTVRFIRNPDRDTYVEPPTADFGPLLLVGREASFEARTFLAVASWNLPDTTLPGFAAQSVWLELPRDTVLLEATQVSLLLAASPWDTAAVAWPGPASGSQLGTALDDRIPAVFSLPLDPGSFTLVKQWARDPASVPGFVLQVTSGDQLASYKAGVARFRVSYAHDVSGNSVTDTIDTPVAQDFYLRSPLSPAPTGVDTALALGGLTKTGIALRFPTDSIPTGISVDEATLVLRLLPGTATPNAIDSVATVEVRRIRGPWTESVTQQSSLTLDAATLASVRLQTIYSGVDRRVSIRISAALLREWAGTPSANEGVFISLINPADFEKVFHFGSRESLLPPELHVSYTSLPPVRF